MCNVKLVNNMQCKKCGACCIAPSITSPIPGMPSGKKAGERCIQLAADNTCNIHAADLRPEVCKNYYPSKEYCGTTFKETMKKLALLEKSTKK